MKGKRKTRDLAQTRKEILQAAFLEIYSKGFQGVSIDDIVAQASLTKGAFYHQFPTKLDLGYALVEEVITPMILERWITPLDGFENPVEGIIHQLRQNIGTQEPAALKLGCPLNNLVQEMSPVDKGFKQLLQKALDLWVDEMDRHLKRGKKSGFIKAEINTKEVAQFIVMAHEGFYGMLKGVGDPALFRSLLKSLKLYFASITP